MNSELSTGHSTSARGLVPAENGTTTRKGSSISVKSSKKAPGNTLGSGDDDPDDEESRKCLEGSVSSPPAQRVIIGRREQLDESEPCGCHSDP